MAEARQKALLQIRSLLASEAYRGPRILNRFVRITDEAVPALGIVLFREDMPTTSIDPMASQS